MTNCISQIEAAGFKLAIKDALARKLGTSENPLALPLVVAKADGTRYLIDVADDATGIDLTVTKGN